MAGHSKFKNIMHRKGAQDKKRSAMFSKLSPRDHRRGQDGHARSGHEPAAARGGARAKAQSMPKDNIQRAIDKSSMGDAENYEEIRYEGFGPGGVSLIVEALTDNRNRTATNVRTIFSKNGGNLGASGSVSHGFDRLGSSPIPRRPEVRTRYSRRRSKPARRTSNPTRRSIASGPRRTAFMRSARRWKARSASRKAPSSHGGRRLRWKSARRKQARS
jgi:hypothetical protein